MSHGVSVGGRCPAPRRDRTLALAVHGARGARPPVCPQGAHSQLCGVRVGPGLGDPPGGPASPQLPHLSPSTSLPMSPPSIVVSWWSAL